MKKQIPLIATVIAVVVVGALSFYGGMKLGESKTNQPGAFTAQGQNFRQDGAFGPQNGQPTKNTQQKRTGFMGNFLSGEILSIDDKSITLKMPDNGSKIIFLSDSTKIVKSTDADISELAAGTQISVNGTANADGSITASNVQIRTDMPDQQRLQIQQQQKDGELPQQQTVAPQQPVEPVQPPTETNPA